MVTIMNWIDHKHYVVVEVLSEYFLKVLNSSSCS